MQIFTATFKDNLVLRALGFLKIPMLGFTRPRILELTDERTEVRIPLSRRTKNHLNSMYFGAFAVGADTAVGLLAFKKIRDSGKPVNLIFKDFHAKYHRRAENHVHFVCEEGRAIGRLVDEAVQTKERVSKKFNVHSYVAKENMKKPVATFTLTLSLKLA